MKTFKKVIALMAAMVLAFGLVAPASAADVTTNTATLGVTLTESGVFAVSFVGSHLDPISANTGGDTTGYLCVKYQDTKTYRDHFVTRLQASNFQSTTVMQPFTYTTPYSIPASSLFITKNFDTFQGRWSSAILTPVDYDIGDIGVSSDGADDDDSSGVYDGIGALNACSVSLASRNYQDWTNNPTANTNLGANQIIGFGFEGPGTAGQVTPYPYFDGTLQIMYIKLTVPAMQPADLYQSTLTVTVTFDGP